MRPAQAVVREDRLLKRVTFAKIAAYGYNVADIIWPGAR
jgi:hypothetical protein